MRVVTRIDMLMLFAILLGGYFTPIKLLAQDIHFSQFYHSPLSINPANTGVFKGDYRFSSNYKKQWKSISNPYKTVFSSIDFSVARRRLGLGLSFFNDKAGKSNMGLNKGDFSMAYNLRATNTDNFIVGIQGGFGQRSMNTEGLKWDNQFNGSEYDASLPTRENNFSNSYTYIDVAAGIMWNHAAKKSSLRNSSTGVALYHINQPKKSFYTDDQLDLKLIVHHSSKFKLPDMPVYILPQVLVMQQGPHNEISVGGLVRYVYKLSKKVLRMNNRIDIGARRGGNDGEAKNSIAIFAGGQFRYKDAFIPAVGFEVFKMFLFSFSYDVNVSQLHVASNRKGGMELALTFKGGF